MNKCEVMKKLISKFRINVCIVFKFVNYNLAHKCIICLQLFRETTSTSSRDNRKVFTMVFYLSNLLTNTFMFGIILNNFSFSMFKHNYQEDFVMQI